MSMNQVSSAVNPNFTPASLYVGDLNADVSEALLFEVFNSVGPVASIRVCRDVVTRRSLGYAYVNFHNVTDAERALDTMNFSSIRGRPCRIMWSQRDPSLRKSGVGNIFVKNLDKSIDHKTLYDTFSMFGNILSCKVATDEKGESLGYGFVHYETAEAAQKAIDKVNGMVIASREVLVQPFKPKAEREGTDGMSYSNLYVKDFPVDFDEKKFSEEFAKFGTVTSFHLPCDADGKLRGFGFVNFESVEDAHKAVEALNGKEPHNMYVGRAQKKSERLKELRLQFDKLRMAMAEKYAGVNLYIKNLADEVDDERLREEFKQFGDITSAKVMCDENERSRGFGFVCFTKREEATKAVTDMNGKLLCDKPLYVALAQRKEIRRAHLEAQAQVNRQKITGMAPMYPPTPMMYPQQPAGIIPRTPAGQFVYPAQAAMMQQQQQQQQRWGPRGGPMPMRSPQQQVIPNLYMGGGGSAIRQVSGVRGTGGAGGGAGMKPLGARGGASGGAQAQRIKFNDNVRNPNAVGAGAGGGAVGDAAGAGGAAGASTAPLDSRELANAPPQQQKQMIGERIFPLVQERQPKLAGKITGMLLEMDNVELLHLLESHEALEGKIMEALEVLKAHEAAQTQQHMPAPQQVIEAK